MRRTSTAFTALLALLLLAQTGFGQGNSPATWRALYQGDLGGDQVLLDLTLYADSAFGRLTRNGSAQILEGPGTNDQATATVVLSLHEPDRPTPTASAIDYAYYAHQPAPAGTEVAPRPVTVATLTGTRSVDWAQDGDTLTVSFRRGAGPLQTTELTRTAQYAFNQLTQGRIDVGFSYPRFTTDGQALNGLLQQRSQSTMDSWVANGRQELEQGDGLGWAWTHHEVIDLVGFAGPYSSLLSSYYYDTGGAHPNSHMASLLLERTEGGAAQLNLSELFAADADWLKTLAARVLIDLAAQDATWVVNGDMTTLSQDDLATFTLGPAGLTFYFDPYAVGPYVQGAFQVNVPYADLLPLATPGGVVEEFARVNGAL